MTIVRASAWQREFRLVFGASTAASAAVLAIFIGGLGLGGIFLGKRADKRTNPLRSYADLEMVLRLILASLVLAVPTFLMGATLPAAARAVETDDL